MPKYPHVIVEIADKEGNAFTILGLCKAAAEESHLPADEVSAFLAEATTGDYEHLLQTAMRWFTVV